MIRYSLVCEKAHAFEAWFRDSQAFDDQSRQGHVGCPHCGSGKVRKALMAPSIRRSSRQRTDAPAVVSEGPPKVPVAIEGPGIAEEEKFRQMRSMLRELHGRVRENAEDVGRTFPVEARKMHDGDVPARSIYGTASAEEVRSLLDDGIGVLPLPALPEDLN